MTASGIDGWDVGGAHLKRAVFTGAGRLAAVRILPCALWRGLDQLQAALDTMGADPARTSFVTMTGELVDLWPDRAAGVAALVAALADRLGSRTRFYAGPAGFLDAPGATAQAGLVASANWHATAAAAALALPEGLLVDMGSTTSDLIPFAGGQVAARGFTDPERLATGELVYTGAARTPVMALARALPFAGAMVPLMAEHFATTADVHRLTGDLPADADLHPAADNGAKSVEGSARRLLRMVGRDLGPSGLDDARRLAQAAVAEQLHLLERALALVCSAGRVSDTAPLVGAGVGRFLARRLAARCARPYVDLGALLCEDERLAGPAADCAPAVAVGRLAFAGTHPSFLPDQAPAP